jgi:hypothetical protein
MSLVALVGDGSGATVRRPQRGQHLAELGGQARIPRLVLGEIL